LANIGFRPDERFGVLVVRFDEGIDVLPELLDRGEGGPSEGFSLKDGEPDLDLIEPGGPGRSEVELHVWVPLKPAIILRLMGIEIVEDDVDGGVRIVREDIVHEIEEFDPAATILVGGGDLAGRHFKGRKEGRSAMRL